jgi:hypothetical protein
MFKGEANEFLVPWSNMYHVCLRRFLLQSECDIVENSTTTRYIWCNHLPNKWTTGLHLFNRMEQYEERKNMRNCNKYVTLKMYLQNPRVYTKQGWIPFWRSKCIVILFVTFNLPSKLAQAVTLLSFIGASPFQISHGTQIVLRSTSWSSLDPPRKLRYVAVRYPNSLFRSYPVCPVYVAAQSVSCNIWRRVMAWIGE